MAGEIQSFSADQAWISVAVCLAGAAYAVWFRHHRTALAFVLLLWLALGFGAAALGQFLAGRPGIDAAAIAAGWLPWNLLLLAFLPAFPPNRRSAAALVGVLAAQYLFAFSIHFDAAQINERMAAGLPELLKPWLSPVEPVVRIPCTHAMRM